MPTRGGGFSPTTPKRKKQQPSVPQMQATTWGAKSLLPPHLVPPPKPKPAPRFQRQPLPAHPTIYQITHQQPTVVSRPAPAMPVFRRGTAPAPAITQESATRSQRKRLTRQYNLALQTPVSVSAQRKLGKSMTNAERAAYHARLKPPPGQMYIKTGRTVHAVQMAGSPLQQLSGSGHIGQDVAQIIGGFPSMVEAGGKAIGQDFYDIYSGGRPPVPFGHTLALGKDIGESIAKGGAQALALPSPKAWDALLHGDMTAFMRLHHRERDQAIQFWKQHPIIAGVNVAALAAPFLRGASIGALTDDILKANPGMGVVRATNLARHESFKPGYLAAQDIEGGIAPRVLTAGVDEGGVARTAAKPLASTPLGRAGQRIYDRQSARIDPNGTLVGRFSEQSRAVRQLDKRQSEAVDRAQLEVQLATKDLTRYVKGTRVERLGAVVDRLTRRKTDLSGQRARSAGVVYGLQGPEAVDPLTTLHAVRADLQNILDTGGKEIPTAARLRIERRMDKLDEQLNKLGLGIDESAPGWADLRNVHHETGMPADQIETTVQAVKHAARVWARERPGRNPSDYLASPEGAFVQFVNQLPEDGLHQVLFQRPGYSTDVVRRAVTPEVTTGDLLHDPSSGATLEPLTVIDVRPGGTVAVLDAQGVEHTLAPSEVAQLQHQSLQPGQRVAQESDVGTVVSSSPYLRTVTVKTDSGTTEQWPIDRLQEPRTAPFYSKMTQTVIEKMPNKMGVNDLETFLLGKQVKPEEIIWSGIRDFLDTKRAAGEKSVTKQELLDWIDNKSPFNLNELYLTHEGSYGSTPRWGREGLTTRPHDPDYREMVMTLGGPKIFRHGHWSDVSNPIFHVRFIHDHETNTLYINEIQSDWHGQIRYAERQGKAIRDPYVSEADWQVEVDKLTQKAQDIKDQNRAFQLKALGIPEDQWDQWTTYVPIRDLMDSLSRSTTRNVQDAMPNASYQEINLANRAALDRLHAQPEWHTLLKLGKIEHRLMERAQSWDHQANNMRYAEAAAPLSGSKWREVVLKWAVAHAVEQGFDKVAWDSGVVQAVRYHHYEPAGSEDYYHDDYAPDPPEPSDYEHLTTEASVEFVPPSFPVHEQLNMLGAPAPLDSGLMDETYSVGALPSDYLTVGERFVPEEGPLAGQLVELLSEGGDGQTVRLRPTGITRIHFSGRSDGPNSSYGDMERTVTRVHTANGGPMNEYDTMHGHLEQPSDHLGDLNISTEGDIHNNLDHEAGSSSDWITDDEAYSEALADHEAEYGDGSRPQGTSDPEDINHVDIWHDSNTHAQLYDEPRMIEGKKTGGLLHGDVKNLFGKKYKVEVREGRRQGKYTAEGREWESDVGPIKVWEFPITPEMAADARKGQTLFQQQEGVPLGASWKTGPEARRMVALLQDANVSTFLHEMVGHGTDELSRRFPEEWAAVEKAMKKPLDQWKEADHEKFARWSERYFREGKAPTPEVAPLMAQLKKWLRDVYHSILELGRPIPQEARDLLDRYLGKKGEGSVFSPAEQALMKEHGQLAERRQELVKAERDRLLAQPSADLLDHAHTLMADGTPAEQQAAYSEIAKRRKGKEGPAKPSEEQRLISRQIKLLDDAIRSAGDPKSGFTDALAALTTLSEHADKLFRQTILDMAPEDAKPGIEAALEKRRNILVNRWRERGLLPYGTGDALGYFPHASIFESLGKQLKGPVRQPQGSARVLGKPKVSPVAVRRGDNLLRRYQSGKLNLDPKVLLNTVNARLRLVQTREARDTLWEMGRPVSSEADVPQGWWIINREGKHVPERLRRAQEMTPAEMDDMVAAGEDFDSHTETSKGMDELLTDYASSFARPADNVPPDWWKAGELRAVPPEVVDGLLPKPFQGKPGGKAAVLGIANSAARAATILQYPLGYMLSNIPANLLMQGLTHPSALVRDNFRALALRKRNPDLYHQLAQVAGDIMAEAGIPDFYPRSQGKLEGVERGFTRGTKRVAEKYGEVADTPFRVGTLMGYARRYGLKTDDELAALVKGGGRMGDLRDALGQRTRDDLIDFNTLTQSERETVARYFFLWPLVRGMAKWPVTFARDHPIAAAAIANAGSDQFTKEHGYAKLGTPSQRALRHLSIIPVGDKRAVDLTSVNPLGGLETIQNLLNAPDQLSRGDLGSVRDTLAGMTIPQIRELFNNQPAARAILEATVPGAKYFTSSLGKSRGSKIWKRENWWNYMLERNVRFDPEEVDAAMMRSQADRERRQQTGTTAAEVRSDAEYAALPKILKRAGVTDPADIKAINNGFEAYNYVSSRVRNLDDAGRVNLVNGAIRQFYPQYASDLKAPSEMSKEEQKRYYDRVRNVIYATHQRVISTGEKMGVLPSG